MLRCLACEVFASVRQSSAVPTGEAFVRVHARACTGAASSAWTFEQELSSQFEQNPRGAARAISRLPEEHKSRILEQIAHEDATLGSPKYLHSLFRDADKNKDGVLDACAPLAAWHRAADALCRVHTAQLPTAHQPDPTCRDELSIALKKHQIAIKDTRVDIPSRDELLRIFTASTLPFVGFGFLDNLIMVRRSTATNFGAVRSRDGEQHALSTIVGGALSARSTAPV